VNLYSLTIIEPNSLKLECWLDVKLLKNFILTISKLGLASDCSQCECVATMLKCIIYLYNHIFLVLIGVHYTILWELYWKCHKFNQSSAPFSCSRVVLQITYLLFVASVFIAISILNTIRKIWWELYACFYNTPWFMSNGRHKIFLLSCLPLEKTINFHEYGICFENFLLMMTSYI